MIGFICLYVEHNITFKDKSTPVIATYAGYRHIFVYMLHVDPIKQQRSMLIFSPLLKAEVTMSPRICQNTGLQKTGKNVIEIPALLT